MHYFNFKIGDFKADTDHLTLAEKGLYMTLMELYLRSEAPLTSDLKKLARLSKAESIEQLEAVLDDFFILESDVYRSELFDEIIEEMREKSEKAKESGKRSAAARKSKGENKQSVSERPATVEQTLNDRSTNAQRTLNDRSTNAQRTLNDRSTTVQRPFNYPITQEPINPITHIGGRGVQGGNSPPDHRQDCTSADADGAPPRDSPPEKPDKSPPKAKAKRGTRLADDFVMPDTWITDAISWRPDLPQGQIRTESTAFCNYWQAKTGAAATKLDWHKTWHNWVLKAHAKPEQKVRSASEIKTFEETDYMAGLTPSADGIGYDF